MNVQSGSLSLGFYLRSKLLGKVRRRVQEMRYTSSTSTKIDLSHNESARLATDALLDRGLGAYHEALTLEAEVDFLSQEEKDYILRNVKNPGSSGSELEEEQGQDGSDTVSQTSVTYFPVDSESDPPELEYGWPASEWSYHLQGMPTVEVFLQSDRTVSVRDLLREGISKATSVLAIVMDTFSDVEIFCDILEATRKRNVSVYLLLDDANLHLFMEMCANLQIGSSHLTRMSVRSVCGDTYCAKSGRKFTGQVKEKFVIIDCTQVLAGSFSFAWLSWQVHRDLAVLFKGSGVKAFDLEFRQLYASSKPVPGFPPPSRPSVQLMDRIGPRRTRPATPPATQCLAKQPGSFLPLGLQSAPKRHVASAPIVRQPSFGKENAAVRLGWRSHQMVPSRPEERVFGLGFSLYFRSGPNIPPH